MNKTQRPGAEKFLQGLLRISQVEADKSFSPAARQALSHIPLAHQLPGPNVHLSSSEKVLLTRKANEFFRLGQIQVAEKIYLAVGYSAGLGKLAEYYFGKNDFLKAYLFSQAANDSRQVEALTERFTAVVRKWLVKGI